MWKTSCPPRLGIVTFLLPQDFSFKKRSKAAVISESLHSSRCGDTKSNSFGWLSLSVKDFHP